MKGVKIVKNFPAKHINICQDKPKDKTMVQFFQIFL